MGPGSDFLFHAAPGGREHAVNRRSVLADDEPDLRKLLRARLVHKGFEVFEALRSAGYQPQLAPDG